jgi:glycosyltransferase involved in cell wall biosynthesis
MQVGLPIVATNHGGQIDLVKDEINGFLVDIKNENQIAQKVELILQNNSLKQNFSNYNLNQINNFSLQSIADKYEKILSI